MKKILILLIILFSFNLYAQCTGDTNEDGIVNILDLVMGVTIILEGDESDCPPYVDIVGTWEYYENDVYGGNYTKTFYEDGTHDWAYENDIVGGTYTLVGNVLEISWIDSDGIIVDVQKKGLILLEDFVDRTRIWVNPLNEDGEVDENNGIWSTFLRYN